ncbi:EAL domain-containing protein [Aliikangiella sp. IMCC44653]
MKKKNATSPLQVASVLQSQSPLSASPNQLPFGYAEFSLDSGKTRVFNSTIAKWAGLTAGLDELDLFKLLPKLKRSIQAFTRRHSSTGYQPLLLELRREGLSHGVKVHCLVYESLQKANPGKLTLLLWMNVAANSAVIASDSNYSDSVLHSVPFGVFCVDSHWRCTYVNPEFCRLTEKSERELLGNGWASLFDGENDRLQSLVTDVLKQNANSCDFRLPLMGKDSRTLRIDFKSFTNSHGQLEQVVGTLIDISEGAHRQSELERLANTDPVTGLFNRETLQHQLQRYLDIAKRINQKLQAIFIELGRFKVVNDLYGHAVGDRLLRRASSRILNCVRSCDMVARIGGDEFVVLFPGSISHATVNDIAAKIIDKLTQAYVIDENEIMVSAYAGISAFDGDETLIEMIGIQEMFRQADIALETARQPGQSNIQRFSVEISAEITAKYNIAQKLPSAIRQNNFKVVYQPIVHAKTQQLASVEALIRWQDIDKGHIPPDLFIPLAENLGFIEQVSYCLVESIGRDLQDSNLGAIDNSEDIRIAINLSGLEFSNLKHIEVLVSKMLSLDIEPSRVTIEVTEYLLVHFDKDIERCFKQLKQKGFKFALDDFGTGYSSYSYLTRFPFDYLKLDKTFIDTAMQNPNQLTLIKGIIATGQSLNLKLIAEGVETQAQYEMLTNIGCDLIQGYYISKPLPLNQLEQWIRGHDKQ